MRAGSRAGARSAVGNATVAVPGRLPCRLAGAPGGPGRRWYRDNRYEVEARARRAKPRLPLLATVALEAGAPLRADQGSMLAFRAGRTNPSPARQLDRHAIGADVEGRSSPPRQPAAPWVAVLVRRRTHRRGCCSMPHGSTPQHAGASASLMPPGTARARRSGGQRLQRHRQPAGQAGISNAQERLDEQLSLQRRHRDRPGRAASSHGRISIAYDLGSPGSIISDHRPSERGLDRLADAHQVHPRDAGVGRPAPGRRPPP